MSKNRRIELLLHMSNLISELKCATEFYIWNPKFGKRSSREETYKNWEKIASDEQLWHEALETFALCATEKYCFGGNIEE